MSSSPSRQRKTKEPCSGCGLHRELCICAQIPKLNLSTKLVLIIHTRELKRTTNTGQLALQSLSNSEMRVRGQPGQLLDLSDLLNPKYQSLLFYPSEEAVELTSELVQSFQKPIQLFVPDGNWRQAGKVSIRHKEISHLPRVMIKFRNEAEHHLRAEHTPYGMSTLE
ncbi:MAG: DTW domain-containing protein, partial [Pseudobdellovibrionaceae bacterium]